MRPQPVVYVWKKVEVVDDDSGEVRRVMAMVPMARYANVAARQFTENHEATLAPVEERSQASHNAFFAALNEYYDNLPETVAARWPSSEHFRKWCLVHCSFFDEKEFDFHGRDAQKQAQRLGTFIRAEDEYCVIALHEVEPSHWKVIIRRAQSQAINAMGKERFEASKKALLDLAASFVGVEPGEMMKHAGKHG